MRLALLFLCVAAPLSAQRLDPDWCLSCRDSRQHFVAGVGIGIVTRAVLPKAPAWKRLAVTGAVALAYELGQSSATERTGRGYGASPKDWLLGMTGAALVELLWRRP